MGQRAKLSSGIYVTVEIEVYDRFELFDAYNLQCIILALQRISHLYFFGKAGRSKAKDTMDYKR